MAKRRKSSPRTPRYSDIGAFVDKENIKDFADFVDKLGEYGDAVDGAARKSRHFKDHVSDIANSYKDAFDELSPLGRRIVKLFQVQADAAGDLADRIDGYSKASFNSINPKVQEDILKRLDAVKQLTTGYENFSLSTQEGISFLKDYTGRIGGDISNWVTSAGDFSKHVMRMGPIIAPIALFVGAIAGSFLLIHKLFTKSLERLTEIEQSTINIRKEFGISSKTAQEFHSYISGSREEFMALGLSTDNLADNMVQLTKEFGFIRRVTRGEISLINQLNARLGLAADASAGVLKIFNMIGDQTREVDQNMILSTIKLSEAGKVANAEVFADIRDNSEDILTYFRGTEVELSQAVIRAKQLGISISNITSFASKLLDFESSIASELEASVLLGRQLNLDRARRLAFEGDMVGLQEELLNITKSVGSFDEMNAIERRAISEALGLSVTEMRNMVVLEEKLSKLTEKDRKMFAEMTEEQKAQLAMKKEITGQDLRQVKSIGDMQTSTDRIKNQFNAMIGNIVRLAEPAVRRILQTITKITNQFNATFNNPTKRRSMEESFNRIANSISTLLDKLFNPDNLQRIAAVVERIINGATGIVDFIMRTFGGGTSGGSGVSALMNRATGTSPTISGVVTNSANQNMSESASMNQQSMATLSKVDETLSRLQASLDRGITAVATMDGRRVTRQIAGVNA